MKAKPRQGEQGMALLAALMMVFIFSLLAMASLQFANQETVGVKAMHDEASLHELLPCATLLNDLREFGNDPRAEPSDGGHKGCLSYRQRAGPR